MHCDSCRSDVLAFCKFVYIFRREQVSRKICLDPKFVDLFWLFLFIVAVLREGRSGVRFPARARLFQLFRNVQTSCGPAQWVTGGRFAGVNLSEHEIGNGL